LKPYYNFTHSYAGFDSLVLMLSKVKETTSSLINTGMSSDASKAHHASMATNIGQIKVKLPFLVACIEHF
jgi:hypothetical protein